MASSGTTSTRKRFTGAEFIVHFLEQQGIKIVTGIPALHPACLRCLKPKHANPPILARHEQGAGFIAQGWRAPTVNRRSVWPVADRVRLTW